MERVLDLGCGPGDSWRKLGMADANWRMVGIDRAMGALVIARDSYSSRGWSYLRAYGEELPLREACVDGIICNVALPYMHIPRTLAELHRVLVPGGWLNASLHLPGFTWSELTSTLPAPKRSLFRVFVLVNGMLLHCVGRVIAVKRIAESCQTERGMRIALQRAGFQGIRFRREKGRFFVDARRDGSANSEEAPVQASNIEHCLVGGKP